MTTRAPVELTVSDGTVLRGEYLSPDVEPPWPVVVMSHGFGVVRTMALPAFADTIAEAGIAVLSQVPTISGSTNASRRATADALDGLRASFAVDRAARLAGADPVMVPNARTSPTPTSPTTRAPTFRAPRPC